MINPDIFGYYTVGQFKTYRKLEAIETHVLTGIHPHWSFNDDVFGAMDCTIEPGETLEELYRQRAQQLREKYDYLVLWYSGGSDCDAVLNAFVDNNILIDEVASCVNYSATGDQHDSTNGEVFNVAIPKIKRVQEKFPLLKHRVIDFCQPLVDFFNNESLSQDWIYHVNTIVTPHNSSRKALYNTVPEWVALFDKGKKVGFISGTEKPRLHQTDDGQYHFRFIDIIDNSVTAEQQSTNAEWFNPEFFFWSPDSPLIVVKQAHIIKKFLRYATETCPWFTEKNNGLAFKKINGKIYWLTSAGIHRLIYPGWQPIPYQYKPKSPQFVQKDDWFRRMPLGEKSLKIYKSGLINRWNIVPEYWKNGKILSLGYKACWSNSYNLGS